MRFVAVSYRAQFDPRITQIGQRPQSDRQKLPRKQNGMRLCRVPAQKGRRWQYKLRHRTTRNVWLLRDVRQHLTSDRRRIGQQSSTFLMAWHRSPQLRLFRIPTVYASSEVGLRGSLIPYLHGRIEDRECSFLPRDQTPSARNPQIARKACVAPIGQTITKLSSQDTGRSNACAGRLPGHFSNRR